MFVLVYPTRRSKFCSDILRSPIQSTEMTSYFTRRAATSQSKNVAVMKNNLSSQSLHTSLNIWFTRKVKIPKRCTPKPQLKLLLLHQTSPLVTTIITTSLGENKACNAPEKRMEIQLHRKAHSLWLTILIPPSFIRYPANEHGTKNSYRRVKVDQKNPQTIS